MAFAAGGLSLDFTPPSAARPGYSAMLMNEQAISIALMPYTDASPGLVDLADGRPPPRSTFVKFSFESS